MGRLDVKERRSGLILDIKHEAETFWHTPWSIAGGILYGAVAGGLLVTASNVHRATFRFIVREDSVLEWPQFAAFAGAALFAALVAARLLRRGERLPAIPFALMALSCVFIAGEEISWGQRIFGFETSEWFREINKQNETTLHNVEGVLVYFNLAMLIVSVYAVVASLRFRTSRPTGFWQWFIPPAYLVTAFATMALYKAVRFTLVRGSNFTAVKMGEWAELCLAVGLLAFAIEVWRLAGRHSERTDATASSGI